MFLQKKIARWQPLLFCAQSKLNQLSKSAGLVSCIFYWKCYVKTINSLCGYKKWKVFFFLSLQPIFHYSLLNQIWQKVIWSMKFKFRCFDQIECNSNKIITLHCIEGACYCQAWVQIPNQVPNPLKSIPNWEQKSIQEPPSPWESWHEKGYFLSLLIIAFTTTTSVVIMELLELDYNEFTMSSSKIHMVQSNLFISRKTFKLKTFPLKTTHHI